MSATESAAGSQGQNTVAVPADAEPEVTLAVAAIEDLKGRDLRLLDVRSLTPLTDFMLIVTGTSNRHVKSLADSVVMAAKQAGTPPLGVEGLDQAEWVLVDLGGVVVHIMQMQTRAFYQLEKLWLGEPGDPEALAGDNTPG
ncbi:MAG: ribosome silencing factor [Oceanococcaceae bacterium]